MYEEQEIYEQKKDEFKKQEEKFKKDEAELIEKDMNLQDQMIEFANYLQVNEQNKKKSEQKLKEEKDLTERKRIEILKREKQEYMLKRKTEIIGYKVNSMKIYENYLQEVMEEHQDEYSEISDIKNRYDTLKQSNKELSDHQREIEAKLEEKKNETLIYQKEKDMEIMTLNNEIAKEQCRLDEIEEEKNKIKQKAEAIQLQKLSQTSELGMILMAIENLYNKCDS